MLTNSIVQMAVGSDLLNGLAATMVLYSKLRQRSSESVSGQYFPELLNSIAENLFASILCYLKNATTVTLPS